ncbi:hypothetical protein [Salipaludibacillus neizhouensis]|uniref:hypothetical protein n=1 Tax=Salipaludibacillus neizhouensis TaxID=885475 RepID=UPI00160105AC|nr:hypothetical protein [Salipaludibacillus neizhouensis]
MIIHTDQNYYVPEENQLTTDEGSYNMHGAGTKKDFWIVYKMRFAQYEEAIKNGAKFVIEGRASEDEEFSEHFGEKETFDFAVSEEQGKSIESSENFYKDSLIIDNMGTKEMIKEFTDINDTKEIDGVSITMEGLQYTEFTPNDLYEESFESFGDNEIVALTMKFQIENKSKETIDVYSLRTILDVNGGETRIQSHGMLEDINRTEVEVEPGSSSERLLVFLFDKKYFEIYENMVLEFGPLTGMEVGELFGGESVEFEIPKE